MQMAATEGIPGSVGSGRIAFDASAATLPGVSEPSSVVRSIIRTASSSANTFDSFLIERLASEAARSSSATWSTEPMRGSRGSSGSSKPRGRAGASAIRSVYAARGLDRGARLGLVRVPLVADKEVRERHAERAVLELPDVAQLVDDQVLVLRPRRTPEQDRPVERVAVEAAEPRQPEEPGNDEDPHAP